jgi:RimJ/RimL family protein N-acetyltransferase
MTRIETARLLLRPHALQDFDPWFAMFSDPDTLQSLGISAPSREEGWNRLLRYAGHWSLLGHGMFAVFDKASGEFLGEVGLADFHRGIGEQFDRSPEGAWSIVTSAQGRGIAFEAADACHTWFEGQRGRARTVCIIRAQNEKSLNLASRLGYRKFGDCLYRDAPYLMLERSGYSGAA